MKGGTKALMTGHKYPRQVQTMKTISEPIKFTINESNIKQQIKKCLLIRKLK